MLWFRHLQLRWKLLIMVMPLVLIPLLFVAISVSDISIGLAYEGITHASMDDLEHMGDFSLDLIDGHYRQFEVYQQEKEKAVRQKLKDIVDLAYNLVETHHQQFTSRKLPLESVKRAARSGLKSASVGEGGFISVMDTVGKLIVHPYSEGHVIYDSRDENGRLFIQEMTDSAIRAQSGKVLYKKYSWKDGMLTDMRPRARIVAYRFFSEWGWIISAGTYLDEIYDEQPFENKAFAELKKQITEKKVGETGFIYAASCDGTLVIHPKYEGQNVYTWLDKSGLTSFRQICASKGPAEWSKSFQHQGPGDEPRARIARLEYFQPWDWVIFVEAYEDELYGFATETKKTILVSVVFLSFLVSGFAGMLAFYVANRFTFPIFMMTEEIARARGGRQVRKISVPNGDELSKLAIAYNNMSEQIQRDIELEEKLSKMEKMASIGVLSSGVAHEINNPMGVILGYACHLENKLDKNDANLHFVQEIKQESRRCVKIVQNLLDYAKAPNLTLEPTDINNLLDQILDFATGHGEMEMIEIHKSYSLKLPQISVDGDQLRQVIMNLVLNAAAAMKDGGILKIATGFKTDRLLIEIADSGHGISTENLDEVFEPFFTTKSKGTGLGLAISKQIIEAHLGAIEIDSEVGVGTTVRVFIPVK